MISTYGSDNPLISQGCKLCAFSMYTRTIRLHLSFDFNPGQILISVLEGDFFDL